MHGKAADGATKAAVCAACHGPNGNSTNPDWPRLAGQSAVYIAGQLRLFRSGARPNPVMMPMATALSDQDIADIAVYYEAQTPLGLEADPSFWQAGQSLYVRGDPAREVPACAACHGPGGRGNLAAGYPALRAQQSVYVVKQLNDYASGARYTGGTRPGARSERRHDVHHRQAPDARADPQRRLLRAGHALTPPGADMRRLIALAALLTLCACARQAPAPPSPAAPPAAPSTAPAAPPPESAASAQSAVEQAARFAGIRRGRCRSHPRRCLARAHRWCTGRSTSCRPASGSRA